MAKKQKETIHKTIMITDKTLRKLNKVKHSYELRSLDATINKLIEELKKKIIRI